MTLCTGLSFHSYSLAFYLTFSIHFLIISLFPRIVVALSVEQSSIRIASEGSKVCAALKHTAVGVAVRSLILSPLHSLPPLTACFNLAATSLPLHSFASFLFFAFHHFLFSLILILVPCFPSPSFSPLSSFYQRSQVSPSLTALCWDDRERAHCWKLNCFICERLQTTGKHSPSCTSNDSLTLSHSRLCSCRCVSHTLLSDALPSCVSASETFTSSFPVSPVRIIALGFYGLYLFLFSFSHSL